MCCCVIERVDVTVFKDYPVGTTHLIQHPISEDRYLQQHCCEKASHLASVTLILLIGSSACCKQTITPANNYCDFVPGHFKISNHNYKRFN
jgi:hypothetical protein